MKVRDYCILIGAIFFLGLCSTLDARQNGNGGGGGGSGGGPPDITGPATEVMSEEGELYGDLYVVLRYQGGETRKIPKVDGEGNPVYVYNSWADPVNGTVTYTGGVLWTGLVQEVSFGRMNVSKAPEALMQASFDEAINSINSAIAIEADAAGRLLLTREVYSELEVDPATGTPVLLGTEKKAIDSPLENLALYIKLLSDGHLVTPGDERAPIDRSEKGGIPLAQMHALTDGPSDALRPTIDIEKMRQWGLGHLVDVSESEYYTYFDVTYDSLTSCVPGGNYNLPVYTGSAWVLQPSGGGWIEQETLITGDPEAVNNVAWNAVIVGWNPVSSQVEYSVGTDNIQGFAQMAEEMSMSGRMV